MNQMLASRVMKARHGSTCPLCRHLISTGQQIGKISRGWAHVTCIIKASRDQPVSCPSEQ